MEGFKEQVSVEENRQSAAVESPEAETLLPDYIHMYEISGQDRITAHSFERLRRDKENEREIRNAAENSPANKKKKLEQTNEYIRGTEIKEGLSGTDIEFQKICAGMISSAREFERASLVEIAFATGNIAIQKEAAAGVPYVNGPEKSVLEKKIDEIVEQGFADGSAEKQKACTEMIWYASPDKRSSFVEKGIASDNGEVQKSCVKAIEEVPEKERAALIEQCLESGNVEVQTACAEIVWSIPEENKDQLAAKMTEIVEHGFASNDPALQIACSKMVVKTPTYEWASLREKWSSLIEQGLSSADGTMQKTWAKLIETSKNEKRSLIIEGLKKDNPEIQKICAEMIGQVYEDERPALREKLVPIIADGFTKGNVDAQKIYAQMIQLAPEPERRKLFEIAKEKLGDLIVEPPLYKDGKVSDDAFSRAEFAKTGSKTILVGGELKGKTIVREIDPEHFLSWENLYENHELWQKEAFDYVPIEPIQSFKLNKNALVDVYSGVLDLSFGAWKDMAGDFVGELEEDKKKILDVLEKIKFEHGHTHNNNFCLRFFRDEAGKVDFGRKPRIYLIDFDRAVSPAVN